MTDKAPKQGKMTEYFKSAAFAKKMEEREEKLQLDEEARQAFYKSDRFNEIVNYIKNYDGVIDNEHLLYFPEEHPFTEKEFLDMCTLILEDPENKTSDVTEYFREAKTIFDGIVINVLSGQGVIFFAKKEGFVPSRKPKPKALKNG